MSRKDLRVGIVGFGRMARVFHLPSLARIEGVRVAAVADVRRGFAGEVAALGIERFHESYEEMLSAADLDLVLVCTPPWLHRDPTRLAASRGIPVLCEKPMATTLGDCDAMIAACEAARVPLYLGFIRRFDPGFERLRRAIATGELGRIFHLEAVFDYFVPDYQSPPYRTILDWIRRATGFDVDEAFGTWRVSDPRVGGGIFQDHGPHYADLFRFLLADEIDLVGGACQRIVPNRAFEDQAAAFLRFRGGATAFLRIGLATLPGRDFREYGAVHGTRASMRFQISSWWFTMPFWMTRFHRNRLRKYSLWTLPLNLWRPVGTGVWRRRWMGERMMRAIIADLRGELGGEARSQLATGVDGRRAMEAVIGLYRATELGAMVRPDLLGREAECSPGAPGEPRRPC